MNDEKGMAPPDRAQEGGAIPGQVFGFLDSFCAWATLEPNLLAAGLCGSHTRGTARSDSDIDLVMITGNPQAYLADTDWAAAFGRVKGMQVEAYGMVTSLRVWYTNGLEVEFGLCAEDWAALPPDPGTRRVLGDGFRVLLDREGLLQWLTADVLKKAGKMLAPQQLLRSSFLLDISEKAHTNSVGHDPFGGDGIQHADFTL